MVACTAKPPADGYVCETHFLEEGKEYHLFHNPKADVKDAKQVASAFIKVAVGEEWVPKESGGVDA